MPHMPGLRLNWVMDRDAAKECVLILMDMPVAPTFCVERIDKTRDVRLWVSARTRDYLQAKLKKEFGT